MRLASTHSSLNYKEKNYLFEYSKISGHSRSMLSSEGRKVGFINDIDGGPGSFPSWTNKKGDIWIDFIESFKLKSQDTYDLSKEIETLGN